MRMLDISPDVDEGWQVEQDQEHQGSNQTGLGESQESEIVAEFCLGNYKLQIIHQII